MRSLLRVERGRTGRTRRHLRQPTFPIRRRGVSRRSTTPHAPATPLSSCPLRRVTCVTYPHVNIRDDPTHICAQGDSMTSSPIAGPDSARHALLTMWTIRRFEEAVDDLFARGLMHGTMHLSIGQEASATGACMALRDGRRDHLHPPRPRALHRQGRRPDPDDGRAAGQGDRLLPRPRRLDAHRRRRHRQPRRQRHRRRAASRSPPVPRWPTSCAARTASSPASSATAPPTRAPSTRRSTWPRSGSCRWSSSARTTSTACPSPPRSRSPIENIADRAAGYGIPGRHRRRQRRRRGVRRRRPRPSPGPAPATDRPWSRT